MFLRDLKEPVEVGNFLSIIEIGTWCSSGGRQTQIYSSSCI